MKLDEAGQELVLADIMKVSVVTKANPAKLE